ncbi:MAG: class I SAM-dependent RNA methyltransferase [Lachnospiraceae bacterium]|nr:class I SAM-dependent RNA methyltransferase [Lachnospiraceae bacterium]
MTTYELIAPCHFGLESVCKREIHDLGYDVTHVSDGRVTFTGDAEAVCLANLCLRTPERILLQVGQFAADSYEALYQGTKALPWEDFLQAHSKFWVTKASCVRAKLYSPSDIQSVMKKAIVDRLSSVYHMTHFPEDGGACPLRVFVQGETVSVCLDTTGPSLHKRGYRRMEIEAPIAENLAAALLALTPWKADRILVDPFCGSGTFLIEAAMMAAHIAPGLRRTFQAEDWPHLIPQALWKEQREALREEILTDPFCDLQGYDIDPRVIEAARHCAEEAGVAHMIHFQVRDVAQLAHRKKYGFLLTNPPYGDRIGQDTDLYRLYTTLGERFRALDDWSMYVITGYRDAEKAIGRKAAKNRKIYNGMIQTYFYQYPGAKPPKRRDAT